MAAPDSNWQTVYERNLSDGTVLGEWLTISGSWAVTPEGIKKSGRDSDGMIMLRKPVAQNAVRVTYEAKSDEKPGDLSLFLGMPDANFTRSVFFGFGTADNTANLLRMPFAPKMTSTNSLIQPGQWHQVTILREAGRVSMSIDGEEVVTRDESCNGLDGPYIALYCWQEGVFRHIKIEQHVDPVLEALLNEKALQREHEIYPEFNFATAAMQCDQKEKQIESLLAERVDVQMKLWGDSQPVYVPQTSRAGWGTLARLGENTVGAVVSADREGQESPDGKIQLVVSRNNGIDWDEPVDVVDTSLSDRDPSLLALQSGRWLVCWRAVAGLDDPLVAARENPNEVERWKKEFAALDPQVVAEAGNWYVVSDDQGKTWSAKAPLPVYASHGPIQLKDGHLLSMGRGTLNGQAILGVAESRDNAQSWHLIWSKELNHPELQGIQYAHMAELQDGRILALFTINPQNWDYRGACYLPNQIWQMESEDGGKTWSLPRITPMSGFPPHLTVLKDGRLLCTYGYRKGIKTAAQRAVPNSQRACLSSDGGKTWDYLNEITIRGDVPDKHIGFPTTVETDDGYLLSFFSQSLHTQDRPGLERVRWALPPVIVKSAPESDFIVEMSEPSLVVAGPAEERRWGFYQFPDIFSLTDDSKWMVVYHAQDDTIGGGASTPVSPRVSVDRGHTWRDATPEELHLGFKVFRLKNGTELNHVYTSLHGSMKPMSAAQFNLQPLPQLPEQRTDLLIPYRYADLPEDCRGFIMMRTEPGQQPREYFAPLDFPNLVMTRYLKGHNTDLGTAVDLPDELAGPLVRDFVRGATCELPDGTILSLCGAKQLQSNGAIDYVVGLLASEDAGRSWRLRATLAGTDPSKTFQACEENNLIRRPNGTLVAILRNEGAPFVRPFYAPDAYLTTSKDNGYTWSKPHRFENFGVLPRLLALDNGLAIASYGRPGVDIRVTGHPDGMAWGPSINIHQPVGMLGRAVTDSDSTCGYTGLLATGPDSFIIVYSDFYYRDADWILHKAILTRNIKVIANN